MTQEQFALYFHETRLDLELFRRTGKSFQDFFEQIMQKADPTFIMAKSMRKEGDWKADGYSPKWEAVSQCYAPEDMTGAKAAKKVKEDFDGATSRWQGKMQRWVLVCSSERALPPQIIAAFEELKAGHPALEIDHVGRAGLWDKTLRYPQTPFRPPSFSTASNGFSTGAYQAGELRLSSPPIAARSRRVPTKNASC